MRPVWGVIGVRAWEQHAHNMPRMTTGLRAGRLNSSAGERSVKSVFSSAMAQYAFIPDLRNVPVVVDFVDVDSTKFPGRFYRVQWMP